MKRFTTLGLLVITMLTGFVARAAVSMTVSWETPGSVVMHYDYSSGDIVPLSADQTEIVFNETDDRSVYAFAAEGYKLIDAKSYSASGEVTTLTPLYNGAIAININLNSTGGRVELNCIKIVRDDVFTLDIENGATEINATFSSSNINLDLKNGTQSVNFNPLIDNNLTFTLIRGGNASDIYSITLNGEPVEKRDFYGSLSWTIPALANGDVVKVRVFEGEEVAPKDCTLKLEYAEGLENCITNIYNQTKGTFTYPDNMVDNTINVTENNTIRINLDKEFTYSKFTLNGIDVTDQYTVSSFDGSKYITLTITDETNVLKIEGTGIVYREAKFTGYIMNPEGVKLKQGAYSGTPADLSGGTAITSDINLTIEGNTYTLDAAGTKQFDLTLSEKSPYFYIAPTDGYYIAAVIAKESGINSLVSRIEGSVSTTTPFYIIALPYVNNGQVKVDVNGSNPVKLTFNTQKSANWDNPEKFYTLKEGTNIIDYVVGYDDPISIRPLSTSGIFEGWLDGLKMTPDEESGAVIFEPYSGDKDLMSTVTIFAGSTAGKIGSFILTKPANVNVSASYSTVETPLTVSPTETRLNLLAGTPVQFSITNGGSYGVTLNGNAITADANGVYRIELAAGNNNVVIADQPKVADITSVDPASGETVKKISEIKVTIPIIDEMMETMLDTDLDKIKAITLTNGSNTYSPAELGEPQVKYDSNWEAVGMEYPMIFTDEVTAAGEYTLTIPAGTFYEVAWNDGFEMFMPVDGGVATNEYKATYTIDPNAVTPLDDYTVSPANGSTLDSIEQIFITFNQFSLMDAWMGFEYPETVTMRCGELEHECYFMVNDEFEGDGLQFAIIPMNEDWENDPITTAGEWTLSIPEGTLSYKGEPVPAINLTYTVGASSAITDYELNPAAGKVTRGLTNVTVTFPNATTGEYNDMTIKLTDGTKTYSTTEVRRGSGINANQFTIDFGSLQLSAGQYTLTIPAGAFTLDGSAQSTEIVADYDYVLNWTITPAEGTELTEIPDFIVSFPYATNVEYIGSTYSAMLQHGWTWGVGTVCTKVEDAECPTFKFSLIEGAQNPPMGNLQLTIEEGSFIIDGEDSNIMIANYTYSKPVSLDYVTDPIGDTLVYYPGEGAYWTFIFGEEFSVRGSFANVSVKLDGVELDRTDLMYSAQYNMIMMGITNLDKLKPGKLEVSIPEGAFTLSGTAIPAINRTWNMIAPKDYQVVVTPAEGSRVDKLEKITVAFPEAETAELFVQSFITLKQAKGYDYFGSLSVEEVENSECPTFDIIVNNPPTKQTEYAFEMMSGAFTLDGSQASPEVKVTFTLDENAGISNILINGGGKVTVVTVDGKVLYNNADSDVLNKLDNGYYIINGQKLYIKK
ncbi:MAG: hypothetical protein HDR82_03420 [Bacteroides sp.]|nr:hypothetical protein [Bacteroides sp.]